MSRTRTPHRALVAILAVLAATAPGAAVSGAAAPDVTVVLKAHLGTGRADLAGKDQDAAGVTDGFPPAFDVDEAGRIFVLDPGKNRVAIFDAKGKLERESGLAPAKPGPGKAPALFDLSVAADGCFAVADSASGSVAVHGPAGERVASYDGLEGLEAISLGRGHRLRVQQKGRVLLFARPGDKPTVVEIPGVRPWAAKSTLFATVLKADSSGADLVRVLPRAKSLTEPFASLAAPKAGALVITADILGVRPDGGAVAVIVAGEPYTARPDPSDQRLKTTKYAVVCSPSGSVLGSFELPQADVTCRVTPRFHRVGGDGQVYTARVGPSTYEIVRHRLETR